jgi:hypothetical protein
MQHDLFSKSLLERAGLERRHKDGDGPHHPSHRPSRGGRYDVLDDRAGQIKDPNRPT